VDETRSERFRDGVGYYKTAILLTGVWVSDRPLDENEGAVGRWVLAMEVPADVLEPYEVLAECMPYREFVIPAEVLNRYKITEVIDD